MLQIGTLSNAPFRKTNYFTSSSETDMRPYYDVDFLCFRCTLSVYPNDRENIFLKFGNKSECVIIFHSVE